MQQTDNNDDNDDDADDDAALEQPQSCRPALQLLLRLALSAIGVAVACAECAVAVIGFAASCPGLSRHLLAAGISALVGCAPMAASDAAAVVRFADALSGRLRRQRNRRRLAERDARLPLQLQPPSVTTEENDTVTETSIADDDDEESALDADLNLWALRQCDNRALRLIKADSRETPKPSALAAAWRFMTDAWEFYRPPATEEGREQRRLIVALICLPVSCAYALLLFQQLYSVEIPGGGRCPAVAALGVASRCAVWLRAAAAGAALASCLVATGVSLARRRHHGNSVAARLRPQKRRLFSRLFG